MRKWVVRFWVFFTGSIVFAFLFFYGIAHWDLLGELPPTKQLENPKFFQASEIYSADGKLIGTYYTENRINVDYKELPPNLVNALIATEDKRYWDHSGVDFYGLGRAVTGVFVGGKGGASTITQQLAKQLFTKKRDHNIFAAVSQKLKEWVMAVRLEKLYTKEEIVAMYFNQYNFFHSSTGVYNAARTYFNKNVKELTVEECATLVGMFKSPVLYNPKRKDNSPCLNRRNTILNLMANQGFVSSEDLDSLKATPLNVAEIDISDQSEYAAYFKEHVRAFMKDWAKQNDYNLYTDGLKIYTTIDSRMQRSAEQAVIKHLSKELQPAFEQEWKKRKNGPFYFNAETAEEEKAQLDQILMNGMRGSDRYKKAYFKRSDLTKAYAKYNEVRKPYNAIVDSLEKYQAFVFDKEREIRLYGKRDSLKYYEKQLVDLYQEQVDDALEIVEDFQKEVDDLKEELDTHFEAYQKLLVPFEDSLKVVFKKPVQMKVFTWSGEKEVEMSPWDSIFYHKKFLRAGLLSIDPHTGYVKAWVGGINYKKFKYDHVLAKRQAGSSFKPFVYAKVIEDKGYDGETKILNKEIVFEKGEYDIPEEWIPKNAGEGNLEFEMIALKTGLAKSINWMAANLIKQVGVYEVINLARAFGIEGRLEPVPSICLGVADVSLWEMVSAYTAFANKGIRINTVMITRIEDKYGKVLYSHQPVYTRVVSEATAHEMKLLMQGNTMHYKDGEHDVYGTGYRLRTNRPYGGFDPSIKIAGKTGTTQNSSDGWYIGYTDQLVTGVWVGCEDRSAHFRNGALGQGANMALPIWGYYMQKAIKIQ